MEEGLRGNFARGRFLIMLIGALTGMVAFWLICMAYFQLRNDGVIGEHVVNFLLLSGILMVVSLVCFIALIVRYISLAILKDSLRQEPTEYFNAWEIAAQRMALEEDQIHEPGSDDSAVVDLDEDDDSGYDDGYGDDENKPY